MVAEIAGHVRIETTRHGTRRGSRTRRNPGVGRRLTSNGEVLVRDVRLPLVGTVAMDSVTLDVGSPPSVTVGDRAVLIGSQGDERVTRGGGATARHGQTPKSHVERHLRVSRHAAWVSPDRAASQCVSFRCSGRFHLRDVSRTRPSCQRKRAFVSSVGPVVRRAVPCGGPRRGGCRTRFGLL